MTQNEEEKLKRNLENEVTKCGKSILENDLEKVAEIMSPFYDDIDWEYKFFGRGWSKRGFCLLLLRFGNLNCEIDDLLDLKRIDKSVGWFMGEEKLEYNIFRFKAVKIINNKKVKLQKNHFYLFFYPKSNKICISEMEPLVKISRPKFRIFCHGTCTTLNQQKRYNNFETKC